MLALVLACSTPATDPASWTSHDPVVVTGAPGRNTRAVPTGGAVATAEGWTVAARLPAAIDVWRPWDAEARTVGLPAGWDPGQVVISAPQRAFVALRGAGAILPLTLAPELVADPPIAVCGEPRGLAADPDDGSVYVACRTGELVHVAATGEILRSAFVDTDLRDVVLEGGRLWVSRFRDAEVLGLDPGSFEVLSRARPDEFAHTDAFGALFTYTPHVAWRMIADPDGGVLLLHQGQQIELVSFGASGAAYYGPPDPPAGTADGIVQTTLTEVGSDGTMTTLPPMGVAGVYDLAIAPDGTRYVSTTGAPGYAAGDVRVALIVGQTETSTILGRVDAAEAQIGSALAIDERGELWFSGGAEEDSRAFYEVGDSLITCAACHPDAGEDGHIWRLQATGGEPRRTPALAGGLLDTAPYHWVGDLANLDALWEEVAILRMGKATIDTGPLAAWLDGVPTPLPSAGDPAQIARGEALFTSAEVGCAECHPAPTYTVAESRNVGTGGRFQAPSLRGVGARLPLMHDGCAETLADRFTDLACGGDHHGDLTGLTEDDVAALVAFLESL